MTLSYLIKSLAKHWPCERLVDVENWTRLLGALKWRKNLPTSERPIKAIGPGLNLPTRHSASFWPFMLAISHQPYDQPQNQ